MSSAYLVCGLSDINYEHKKKRQDDALEQGCWFGKWLNLSRNRIKDIIASENKVTSIMLCNTDNSSILSTASNALLKSRKHTNTYQFHRKRIKNLVSSPGHQVSIAGSSKQADTNGWFNACEGPICQFPPWSQEWFSLVSMSRLFRYSRCTDWKGSRGARMNTKDFLQRW